MSVEYKCAPKYYCDKLKKDLNEYSNQREEELNETISEADKLREESYSFASEFLLLHPNGGFEDYLHTIALYKYKKGCLIGAVLGLLAVLVICFFSPSTIPVAIAVSSSDLINLVYRMILGAIFGALVMFCCRAPVMYVYGTLLCFIGYPIFRAFYKHAEKKSFILQERYRAQIDQKVQQVKEDFDADIREAAEEYIRKTEEYKIGFTAMIEEKSLTLMDNDNAKSIAEWATPIFTNLIETADRAPHIETIEARMYVKVFSDAVVCTSVSSDKEESFDFEENRCAKIDYEVDTSIISIVILKLIKASINKKYSNDANQIPFEITIASDYESDYACAIITYTAKNPNFKPVKEW